MQITQFVKTLQTQLYVNVLPPTLVIPTSIADLTHALIQHADKIQNVVPVVNDHCVDVLEDLPEIQTAGLDAMLTLALLIIHVEKEPNVKTPVEDRYAHALQDMQEILM